jgi:hypothetical protein
MKCYMVIIVYASMLFVFHKVQHLLYFAVVVFLMFLRCCYLALLCLVVDNTFHVHNCLHVVTALVYNTYCLKRNDAFVVCKLYPFPFQWKHVKCYWISLRRPCDHSHVVHAYGVTV